MRIFVALSVLLLAPSVGAQTLRCESADGKITYAQNLCPPGTQPVRTVPPPGKVVPEDQRAAAQRARSDASAVERLERDRKAQEAQAARSQKTDRLRAEARERSCKRLALRVKQAKDDADAAPLNRAAQAKRKLKKAQENYELECAPK
jgi:hypothetical protein